MVLARIQHGLFEGGGGFPDAPRTLPSAVRTRPGRHCGPPLVGYSAQVTSEVHLRVDLSVLGPQKGSAAAAARPGSPPELATCGPGCRHGPRPGPARCRTTRRHHRAGQAMTRPGRRTDLCGRHDRTQRVPTWGSARETVTTTVPQSGQLLVDSGHSAHASPDGLQGGHSSCLASVTTDQLENRRKPLLRQLVHQVVELLPHGAHTTSARRP